MSVFCYQISLNAYSSTPFLPLLSDIEKKRAYFYKSALLADRYIIGRGILRCLLGKHLNTSSKNLPITYSSNGKPLTEGIHFNLAHCLDKLVICLSFDVDLGVDIEEINSNAWSFEAEELLFCENEKKQASGLPLDLRLRYFFSVWTQKEALLKYLGSGIQTDLRLIDTEQRAFWSFHPLIVQEPYLSCLVTGKEDIEIRTCEFSL